MWTHSSDLIVWVRETFTEPRDMLVVRKPGDVIREEDEARSTILPIQNCISTVQSTLVRCSTDSGKMDSSVLLDIKANLYSNAVRSTPVLTCQVQHGEGEDGLERPPGHLEGRGLDPDEPEGGHEDGGHEEVHKGASGRKGKGGEGLGEEVGGREYVQSGCDQ